MVLWFYVQELPLAQPAVVLVLKRLRRRGNSLKSEDPYLFHLLQNVITLIALNNLYTPIIKSRWSLKMLIYTIQDTISLLEITRRVS